VYKLFTKPFYSSVIPVIRKIFAPLVVKEFVSVQPMTLPSGLIINSIDFKFCKKMFELYEELWLEDFKDGEWWCPQIEDDCFLTDGVFKDMRWREFIFEDWEIEQFNTYVGGVGNLQKQIISTAFKAVWFPEK